MRERDVGGKKEIQKKRKKGIGIGKNKYGGF